MDDIRVKNRTRRGYGKTTFIISNDVTQNQDDVKQLPNYFIK